MQTVRSVAIIVGTLLAMVLATFVLGAPVSLYLAAKLLYPVLVGVGLFVLAVWAGLIADYGGPWGFSEALWSAWLALFLAVWGWQFGKLSFRSWVRAYEEALQAPEKWEEND